MPVTSGIISLCALVMFFIGLLSDPLNGIYLYGAPWGATTESMRTAPSYELTPIGWRTIESDVPTDVIGLGAVVFQDDPDSGRPEQDLHTAYYVIDHNPAIRGDSARIGRMESNVHGDFGWVFFVLNQ